jgi:predicted ATP-dependent serine protease
VKSAVKTAFLCSGCGNDFPKWHGQCPTCNEWGTLSEFKISKRSKKTVSENRRKPASLAEILYKQSTERFSARDAGFRLFSLTVFLDLFEILNSLRVPHSLHVGH